MLHSPFQVSNQAHSLFSFSRKYSSSSSSTFFYGTSHAIINNKVSAHHEKEKSTGRKGRRSGSIRCLVSKESGKAVVEDQLDSSPVTVKGVLNVLISTGDNLTNIGITRPLDDIQDLLGKSLLVELFSSHLDPLSIMRVSPSISPFISSFLLSLQALMTSSSSSSSVLISYKCVVMHICQSIYIHIYICMYIRESK
ncbi:hypothetical protein DsansV1_C46g0242051 [Dioscorea sansibarensis]